MEKKHVAVHCIPKIWLNICNKLKLKLNQPNEKESTAEKVWCPLDISSMALKGK